MKAITYKTTNKEVNKFVRKNAPVASLFTKAILMNEKATCFEDAAYKIVDGKAVTTSPLDADCVVSNATPGQALSFYSEIHQPWMGGVVSLMPYRDGILSASQKFHAQ